jgi:NADH-quinone oxidoreductase subunit F
MEIGKTYRDLIEGLAGGALPGRTIKAWWPGGSSAPVMPGDLLDTTTDLDGIKDVANLKGHPIPPLNMGGRTFATMGGSGGVIVMDDRFCAVKAAHRLLQFYAHESCGKCTPCRVGGNWAVRAYEHILSGDGGSEDIAILDRVQAGLQGGRCLCGLGDAAGWVIASSLTHFRKEYEEHALHNFCSAEKAGVSA